MPVLSSRWATPVMVFEFELLGSTLLRMLLSRRSSFCHNRYYLLRRISWHANEMSWQSIICNQLFSTLQITSISRTSCSAKRVNAQHIQNIFNRCSQHVTPKPMYGRLYIKSHPISFHPHVSSTQRGRISTLKFLRSYKCCTSICTVF